MLRNKLKEAISQHFFKCLLASRLSFDIYNIIIFLIVYQKIYVIPFELISLLSSFTI
jgi:hypothetical protein